MIRAILIMIIIGLADVVPMVKAKTKDLRTIISYAALYVLAFTLVLLLVAGVQLPSPMLILGEFMQTIGLSY